MVNLRTENTTVREFLAEFLGTVVLVVSFLIFVVKEFQNISQLSGPWLFGKCGGGLVESGQYRADCGSHSLGFGKLGVLAQFSSSACCRL